MIAGKRLAVLLRCYDNPDAGRVVAAVDALGVDEIAVIVNARRDRCDTPVLVGAVGASAKVRVVSPPIYGFARALNAGLAALSPGWELALVVSPEVSLRRTELEELVAAAVRPAASCGFAGFVGRCEETYRLPRNTCCVWPARVFREVGEFDVSLDEKGMEDVDLALRALAQRGWLPFRGPAGVELAMRPGTDLPAKLRREADALAGLEEKHGDALARLRAHLSWSAG